VESFNGRLRDECLNETIVTSLRHARRVLADWRHDYNNVRPHSSLGGATPAQAAGKFSPQPSPGRAPEMVAFTARAGHQSREALFSVR